MNRGEVYDARLEPVEGSEQGGTRPVIIVSRATINTYSTFQVSEVHNRGRDTAVPCPYGNRRAIGVYFINVESAV